MYGARRTLTAAILIVVASLPAGAQKKGATTGGFGVGYTDLGPTVGLGGLGNASVAIGGRFERGIKALPEMGKGTLGIGLSADWYHYSNRYANTDYGFTYIPIAGTANYHFNLTDKKLDPFVGLGLGYMIVNTTFGGSYDSGIYFVGRLGMRYFLNPKLALYGDVGAGAAALNFGVTFRMAGT